MKTWFSRTKWSEVIPRVLADFAVVQGAFVASLWMVVSDTTASLEALWRVYVEGFFPLSFLFPTVFSLCGFYTRSRVYATGYKWRLILSGTTVASLVYVLGHFLLNRADSLPRKSLLLFLVLANAGVFGSRWLKNRLLELESRGARDREGPAVQDRPVLVVGGAGYIGSVACRRLLAAGRRVRVLDSLIYGDTAIRELLANPRFELQVGDCRNIQAVVAAVKGVGAIVHLAAIVGDPACDQDRQSAREINYAATRMLIEVAKGYGVERFLFASSCSVYGAADELMDERCQPAPLSLYGETKVESERALLEARGERFHPVVLRFATVFGYSPRPRFDLVVNLLAAKAYRERKITIYNGEQWRPFLHVEDVAEGLRCALEAPLDVVSGEIFNLGDNRLNATLAQVAEKIRQAFPGAAVEYVENTDRRDYRVSFDKIRRRLGFEARWTLESGIAQLQRALESEAVPDHGSPIYHNQRYLKEIGTIHSEELDARVMAAFAEALLREEHVPANR